MTNLATLLEQEGQRQGLQLAVHSINVPSYRLKNRLAAIERDRDDAA
ncbi:hypothetical protein ACIQCR_34840 [Streptomyces sp. NPDC093249]